MKNILGIILIEFTIIFPVFCADNFKEGLEAFRLKQYNLALEKFILTLKTDSNNYKAYFFLGITYRNLGQYENSIMSFDRVLEFKSLEPAVLSDVYTEMIKTFLMAKQNKKAIQYGLEGLRVGAPSAKLLNQLARAYLKSYDPKRSQKAAEKAIMLESDNAESYYILGLAYMNQNKPERAIIAFETASAFEPENPLYQASTGWAYETIKEYSSAIRYYQNANKIKPDPEYQQAIIRLQSLLNKKQ